MRGGAVMCERRWRDRQGSTLSKPIKIEYLQINETSHAADALRDGAGELVVVEHPAAVD